MTCQILMNKKNISKCRPLKFLPSMQSVNKGLRLQIDLNTGITLDDAVKPDNRYNNA